MHHTYLSLSDASSIPLHVSSSAETTVILALSEVDRILAKQSERYEIEERKKREPKNKPLQSVTPPLPPPLPLSSTSETTAYTDNTDHTCAHCGGAGCIDCSGSDAEEVGGRAAEEEGGEEGGGHPSYSHVTPLHIEAHQDCEAVAVLLSAARCNVDLGDTDGLTALQVAELLGNAGIARLIRSEQQKGSDGGRKDDTRLS